MRPEGDGPCQASASALEEMGSHRRAQGSGMTCCDLGHQGQPSQGVEERLEGRGGAGKRVERLAMIGQQKTATQPGRWPCEW